MLDSFIEIDNIKIFGQLDSKVSVKDIDMIQPDVSSQMHIVRHYNSLRDDYLKPIIGILIIALSNLRQAKFVKMILILR